MANEVAGAQKKPYNILFILTDQERHFRPGELPIGFELPAHERLRKTGTYFTNHRIASCVCTSSRSVIYTGQHIQKTKMFDNTNFPWIQSLDPDKATIGDMLREAGYYTAYKGKWHMTKEFEEVNELGSPTKIFTAEMEAYGFSDYFGIGDIIAHEQGGYLHDGITAAMAGSWMRGKGRELASKSKPWFLAVNFVNPHDVMFFDTTDPSTPPGPQPGIAPIRRNPDDPLYAKEWEFDLPATHYQPLDEAGRPPCHSDYIQSHDVLVAQVAPGDDGAWRRRHNNYLNCLRDADRNIAAVLAELDASGLADRTIIVLTADHGDIDGAHFLHAKGGTAYREQNNVPLIIVHPDIQGGKECRALTSHLDIAPTLISMTGAAAEKKDAIKKTLPGKDISPALAKGDAAGINDVRDGALYNFNMLAYVDGNFAHRALEFLHKGGNPKTLKENGIVPDLRKRGAIRAVFDGQYMFARYFSPMQHNRPGTLEQIHAFNDIELYDLESDPLEARNLAAGDKPANDLILAMNDKMTKLIDDEVGEDPGGMIPPGVEGGWEVSAETMKGF
ncbi:sulfatase-like hydrolase/transferase [Sphingomonas daechungensis]|uniref:sulfatase-like hydrolase/transferase n=1 Tax=Sphingomonas daechungensis TaxID=1176646 RepID=UPI003784ABD1